MGLPIWREPEEQKSKLKTDPTAPARSSIRRRPSVHGSRNRSRLVRESAVFVPRPAQLPSPPPPPGVSRYTRRNGRAGVPPISTLLESADRIAPPPPPPPAPRLRNFDILQQRERELMESLESLHEQAARLRRDTQEIMRHNSPPRSSETGTQTETERRDHSRRLPRPDSRGSRGGPQRSYDRDLRRRRTLPWLPADPSNDRPRSRGETAFSRAVLPTPPLDQSDPDGDSLFLPETSNSTTRPLHPLSRSWRPGSPINGLGDRDRSPTPTDGWEIMQSTIAPDATLPSASSSFASAATNDSFAPSTDTAITEPERDSSSDDESENTGSDTASYLDAEDLLCAEDEAMISSTAQFARDMYYREMETLPGRERIAAHESLRRAEGNRFALASEPQNVDIGFRLIEDALETEEGRGRVFDLQGGMEDEDAVHRMVRFRSSGTRGLRSHMRARSPPPRYSPFPADLQRLDAETEEPTWLTSRDEPQPHPVSPPSARSMREVDALLRGPDISGEELGSMRRVVERLARRDDVPEEWWASMGLDFSRTRPRSVETARRSPDGLFRGESRL